MKIKGITKTALIPADEIAPGIMQPRKFFDEKSMEALTDSIKQYGLICPVAVRRTAKDEYELISGERRFRACVNAGLEMIPAVIVECDEQAAAILSLVQNIHNDELIFTEVADAYKNIMEKYKMTREDLAHAVGKSLTDISRYLKITELPPFVHKLIREYNLTEGHAFALLKLKNPHQQTEVCQKICLNHLTPAQAEYIVHETNDIRRRCAKRFVKTNIRDMRFFENTITRALDIVRKGGFDADMEEINHEWGTEYKIKLMNKKNGESAAG